MCVTELSLIIVKLCEFVGDYELMRSVFKLRIGYGLPVVPRVEVGLLLFFM
jgi:hypothetical protein